MNTRLDQLDWNFEYSVSVIQLVLIGVYIYIYIYIYIFVYIFVHAVCAFIKVTDVLRLHSRVNN